MKRKLKKLLCYTLMVCITLTLFSPAQVQAAKKGDGSRENPYSAYKWHTVDVCNMWGEYTGTVRMKLIKYMDGKEVSLYREQFIDEEDDFATKLKKNEQFVYMKFKIKCTKSKDRLWCGNIVDALYNKKANRRLNAKVCLDELSDGTENITDCDLYKGGEIVCASVHVIKKGKGNTPITFTVPTGNEEYTWFTTKK